MADIRDKPTRLKSLELQGYKTFATKTLFNFAPTITAIVGPNGSGKSNIADAIRWVLGEQAYSLLRGKKTEDMIFTGSELRPRAGLALASITFDNSDEWLPIDFNEVAIGRRAYRDGQNEYLINEQKVRLRDVAELLSESGLAERTYTVIGQGLVDAALSLRAEERRHLFEEAAGIGLYRSRREESIRRLESTRRNLERVQDILAELRPRLRSLERQAQRARDFEQVREDLRSSLRTWYGFHWNRQQEQLSEARRIANEHRSERDQLLERQQTVDTKLERRRDEIRELRELLAQWSGRSSELFAEREQLGRQLAVLRERIRWLEEQRGLMQSELAAVGGQQARLAKSVEVAQAEVEALQAEIEELESAADGEVEGAGLGGQRAHEEESESIRRELEALAGREAAWSARQSQLQERLEEAQAEIDQISPDLESAESRWAELRDRLDKAQSRAERLSQEAEKARQQQRQRAEEEGRLASQLAQAERELVALQADEARLRSSLDALKQAHSRKQSGTNALLHAVERGELKGSKGKLLSMLEVDKDFRTAVSAALGERMEALALQGRSDLLRALELLHDQPQQGRTVLLNMELDSDYQVVEPENQNGVLGNALGFVHAEPVAQRALERLLGRTWIVADRAKAIALREDMDPSLRLVTLAGELFLGDGTVIVGDQTQNSGLAELEAIEAELGISQRQLSAGNERAEHLREQWLQAKAHLEEGEVEAQRLLEDLRQLEADRDTLRQEAEGLQPELMTLRERASLQRGVAAQTENRMNAHAEEAGAFGAERGRLERRLSELRRRRGEGEGEAADAILKNRWDSARQSLESAQARLAETRSQSAGVVAEVEAWEARLSANQVETQTKSGELERLQGEAEAVEAELQKRGEELEPSERKLQQAEKRRAELVEETAVIRIQLQRVENLHSQAQVQLARKEEELRGLQRRIEDDFGLVAFEYDDATTIQEPLPMTGLVEHLPAVEELPEGLETQVQRLRAQLRRMGAINPEAQAEHHAVKERVEFLATQIDDLRSAESHIREVIVELDVIMAREFRKTFDLVAVEFKETFRRLFDGGSARLELTDPDDPNETGIEIEARLPGKREQGLAVLSGGERSLAASALVFALLKVSPTPFCVLDEVDAMLDEVNVIRFGEVLRELSKNTQFIVITHNRQTVQIAEAVYGVSMSADSTSKVISLDLEQAAREIAA